MLTKRDLSSFDFLLLFAVCALVIFGIIAIGSADHINIAGESKENFTKQMFFFGTGLILLFIAAFVNYSYISQFYIIIYVLNISLLIAVLLFGQNVNNATRWIKIGAITIQPSEFAKVIMIFCIAKFIDKANEKINNIFVLTLLASFTLIPVLLIRAQPSLSSSLVLIAILTSLLFAGKVNYKYFLVLVITASFIGVFLFWDIAYNNYSFLSHVMEDYQVKRILAIINPEDYPSIAYQTIKSMQAIGSGQFYGKGLYQGTLNKLSYLPEPNNDFIFSVIGEEFGFLGCAGVLGLLLFIIVKCFWIARNQKEFLGQLIACGIAVMFAFQTFINAGVATGLLPNTGMGLPFISYGGSALWTNMIAIGLILNIGMKRPKSLFEED